MNKVNKYAVFLNKLGLPKQIIDQIKSIDDIKSNYKIVSEYVGNCAENTVFINSIKKSNDKNVIVLLGNNGAGKTTSLFSLYTYFSEFCSCIVTTIDFYKKSFKTFANMIDYYNANYLSFTHYDNFKFAYKNLLERFTETDYSILFIDTSGKNMKENNLRHETENFIKKFNNKCGEYDLQCHFVYVINIQICFDEYTDFMCSKVKLIILSHLDFANFYLLEIITRLKDNIIIGYVSNTVERHKFYVFNKHHICLKICESMSNICKFVHCK